MIQTQIETQANVETQAQAEFFVEFKVLGWNILDIKYLEDQ